ncbi:efflux RND transporter periplasmic adaptor subunit [Aliikangiella coralliicola]|uniref:Efflux RND transporter periplasmic adaptor subunit n=1 Tax=Aliikangiella coralliicola TaxID=2592383 RepID=A0A545UDT5_9GAMM|nr:efflux RND transporter periplasmic adaptor subunit [Aliikangiella coralliicola]TQV87634.1 efflux RND transporter periplasmic adaptor subunit [Aliikangiella coralliicola]
MAISTVLTKKPWIIAIGVIAILTIWMMSGSKSENNAKESAEKLENKTLTKVRVERRLATEIASVIELHGRTEADRRAKLSAETSGRVKSILVKRGEVVEKSQVLIKLDEKDKQLRLQQAKATLKQRELEFQAAKRLRKSGLTAQTQMAENQANLELAKAEVEQAELDLAYTEIRAPFAGIFNDRYVEIGDLLSVGSEIGEILDVNPIIVRGDIPELAVANVSIGQVGTANLITKQKIEGKVRYLSAASDDATHTFKVELALDNQEYKVPVGVSATIELQTDQVLAHKISPAALSLSKNGGLGIKVIDSKNQVLFKPVEIVRSEKDGVWLSGLNTNENIITVGQGFVDDGDIVDPDFTLNDSDTAVSEVNKTAGATTNE